MVLTVIALALKLATADATFEVDGQKRQAVIHRPSAGTGPYPVVIAFHGHGGSGPYASRSYEIQKAWPEALVIYPTGLPTVSRLVDPEGRNNGWSLEAEEQNKDIRYFDVLLKAALETYGGDPKRVFVMGHSNGGFFSFLLWNMRADKLAGIGCFEGASMRLALPRSMPCFMTIGDSDAVVLPKFQKASLEAALKANEAESTSKPYSDGAVVYEGKAPVVLFEYQGGHKFNKSAIAPMVSFFKSVK